MTPTRKRSPGRPEKPERDRRTAVRVSLPKPMLDRVDEIADTLGLNRSEYLRQVLIGEAARPTWEEGELPERLSRQERIDRGIRAKWDGEEKTSKDKKDRESIGVSVSLSPDEADRLSVVARDAMDFAGRRVPCMDDHRGLSRLVRMAITGELPESFDLAVRIREALEK